MGPSRIQTNIPRVSTSELEGVWRAFVTGSAAQPKNCRTILNVIETVRLVLLADSATEPA